MRTPLDNCTYRSCVTLALLRRASDKNGTKLKDKVLAFEDENGEYSLPYGHHGAGHTLVDPQSSMMHSLCYLTGITQFEIEKTVLTYDSIDGGFLTSFESSVFPDIIPDTMMTERKLKWVYVFNDKLDRLSKVTLIGLGLLSPED